MMFCLDDGAELLYGPASMDGPATAILHSTAAPGEAPTRAQIQMTDQTAVLPTGTGDAATKPRGFDKRLLLAPLALSVIVLGGFFGFGYITPAERFESFAWLAVVNEGGNADVEYLSDGMTETLIRSLSQLANLQVKPRSSVFRYKGKETDAKTIGKELSVQAILNGRVIQRGDQLTLNLELIDVQKDVVLWSEQYNRKQTDLVSLQSEIAKDVSAKLKLKLSGADEAKVTKTATANPEAYQAYLKGRYYWNRRTGENLKKAIEQFKAATDRDPNYALAYVGLADCYILLNQYAGTPLSETVPQAKVYAERAIAIGDQLAEPHASLGVIYEQSWQWAEAEREFKRAIELSPNYATGFHWYSTFRRNTGRTNEAAPLIMRAHEIDPLSSVIYCEVAVIYLIQNNHQAAIETCLKVIELDPTFSNAYLYLALAYLKQGRNTEAISNLDKAVELSSRSGETLRYLGYAYSVTGKPSQANAILKELEEKYAKKEANGRDVAGVYAGLGDEDKAFEWLEKDFQSKEELAPIRWQIPYESLRDDPRYAGLLKRMGLLE